MFWLVIKIKSYLLSNLSCFSLVSVEDKMKIYLEYQEKFSRSQTPQRRPLDFTSGNYNDLFIKCKAVRGASVVSNQTKAALELNWAVALFLFKYLCSLIIWFGMLYFKNKSRIFCKLTNIELKLVNWFAYNKAC